MKKRFCPNDFVKYNFGWDALELVFMIQSHSHDLGVFMKNNDFDRNVKDSRIEFCFNICNKLLNDEHIDKSSGHHIRFPVKKFYRIPSPTDLPDGCLYSRQIPDSNLKSHHHFCCRPNTIFMNNFPFNETNFYKIYLKKDAKVLFLRQAIDTIIRKPYKSKLFNNGKLIEEDEIIVLGRDIDRIERLRY